eukprot:scaffold19923_cov70-Phaeocystis_antarctica.AAC.2
MVLNGCSNRPKGVRTRGTSGHTAGQCGRSIDITTCLPSTCESWSTLRSPDTDSSPQNNKLRRFWTDLGPV